MNREQLNNLITLRDKVFPIVFEMDKQGRVDLDDFRISCGNTYLGFFMKESILTSDCSSIFIKKHGLSQKLNINTSNNNNGFAFLGWMKEDDRIHHRRKMGL